MRGQNGHISKHVRETNYADYCDQAWLRAVAGDAGKRMGSESLHDYQHKKLYAAVQTGAASATTAALRTASRKARVATA